MSFPDIVSKREPENALPQSPLSNIVAVPLDELAPPTRRRTWRQVTRKLQNLERIRRQGESQNNDNYECMDERGARLAPPNRGRDPSPPPKASASACRARALVSELAPHPRSETGASGAEYMRRARPPPLDSTEDAEVSNAHRRRATTIDTLESPRWPSKSSPVAQAGRHSSRSRPPMRLDTSTLTGTPTSTWCSPRSASFPEKGGSFVRRRPSKTLKLQRARTMSEGEERSCSGGVDVRASSKVRPAKTTLVSCSTPQGDDLQRVRDEGDELHEYLKGLGCFCAMRALATNKLDEASVFHLSLQKLGETRL